jgi:type IX secretion system substrate protein
MKNVTLCICMFSILNFSAYDKIKAQVVYTDVSPDYDIFSPGAWNQSTSNDYYLDLDNDGSNDFSFAGSGFFNQYGTEYIMRGYFYNNNMIADTALNVFRFNYGDSISLFNSWDTLYKQRMYYEYNQGQDPLIQAGLWLPDSIDYYAGLRLTSGSNIYYGWVRIMMINYPYRQWLIKDYAYEPSGNYIIAGKIATGLSDLQYNNNLHVYPNPAKKTIIITSILHPASKDCIIVYDNFGKIVLQRPFKQQKQEMDLSHLSKGMYIIKVVQKGQVSVSKVVVE